MAKARITDLRLDHKGIGRYLQSAPVAVAVNDLARRLRDAAESRAEDPDRVFVSYYSTDRKAAMLTLPTEDQAKNGALTRAAAAVGLEISPPK